MFSVVEIIDAIGVAAASVSELLPDTTGVAYFFKKALLSLLGFDITIIMD